MVLEVEKDSVSVVYKSADQRRPLRREKPTTDLESTHDVPKLVAQLLRAGRGIDVERN